jgi:polygalacturonase
LNIKALKPSFASLTSPSFWGWLLLFALLSIQAHAAGLFNVVTYGAVADASTDNTSAIQAAINAANSAGGGTVEIPAAAQSYLSGPLTLASNLTLQIDSGATLMMLPMGRYPSGGTNFITASNLSNVTINGGGTIDGQGQAWWTAFIANSSTVRPGTMIYFAHVTNANVSDLTLQNSPMIHQQYWSCTGVTIDHQTIFEPYSSSSNISPNTDGMDIASANMVISNCNISTGDDVIAIGSSSHHATNITITACTFGTGHGLSIGSHTSGGVDHIYVSHCTFTGTQYGLRLKSDRGSGGLCDQVHYSDLTMTGIVYYPIFFTSYYPTLPSGPTQDPGGPATLGTGTPVWQNISFSNINATASGSKAKAPLLIWGLPESLVANVSFTNVHLNGPGNGDVYHASNVTFDCASTINGAVASAANVSTSDATVSYVACALASPTPTQTPLGAGPTATPSATRSASPSSTPSATATRTVTASPSVTATASPTPSPSRTNSVTPSASSTVSPAASPTVSPSRSPTATLSASPSATLTATASATRSASPSATITVLDTSTSSPTVTLTRSPSASPTASGTATASLTPSVTPTSSPSATRSASPSVTLTFLDTYTSSPTVTLTRTPTASVTATSSLTASSTLTQTGTATPSATASASPTSSPSATPSQTRSASPTTTITFLDTFTDSPTVTPTLTRTVTSTASSSATPSATRSATASASPSATAASTPLPSSTPSPLPASPTRTATVPVSSGGDAGPVVLDEAHGLPNPNPRVIALHLQGDVDKVLLRAYSAAWVQVWGGQSGPLPQGWSRVPLDSQAWAPGLYYLSLSPQRGTQQGKALVIRLFVLR